MNSSNQILNKKKPSKTKAFFICLIISSLLWLFHSLNIVYTYTFKVPVNFKNIPQNKKPLIQIPEKLSIDVKASGLKLLLLISFLKYSLKFKKVHFELNSITWLIDKTG